MAFSAVSGTTGQYCLRSSATCRPVVDGRNGRRPVVIRLEPVPVVVADAREALARHLPGDEPVLLVPGDRDGDVVLAHREVPERLAIHVDHELVADRRGRLTRPALQHPRRVDRHVAARRADDREDRRRVGRDHSRHLVAFDGLFLVLHLVTHGAHPGIETRLRVSLRATRVRGVPENYFDDWVAQHYEVLWPHLFDPEVVEPAVSFLADLAGDGRALELGIGTGRLALPLSRRGIRVDGIELSAAMVEQLRSQPGSSDIDVTIGDFSTTKVNGTFTLAYLVRNTIMNLTTQDAAGRVLPQCCEASGTGRLLRDRGHRSAVATTRAGRDRHPVRCEPCTSRLRRDRRGDTELVVAPLLVRRWRDQDLLGAVPQRVAIGVGPHGSPCRDGFARSVERLEPRALHQQEPQPHLGLAEAR